MRDRAPEQVAMSQERRDKELPLCEDRVYVLLDQLYDFKGRLLLAADEGVIGHYETIRKDLAAIRREMDKPGGFVRERDLCMRRTLFEFVNNLRERLGIEPLPERPTGKTQAK